MWDRACDHGLPINSNIIIILFLLLIIGFVTGSLFTHNHNSIGITYSVASKMIKKDQLLYTGTSEFDTTNIIRPYSNSSLDIFGIRKLYDSKLGGYEWYMNMSNPQEDPYLYNYNKMEKNSDRSYNIGNFSRLSVYSKDGIGYPEGRMETYNFNKLSERGYWYKPNDWKNVEITGEYHYRGGNGQGITHYVRSEDHSQLHGGCGGSSYKSKIYFDGTSNFNKEQTHPFSSKLPHFEHNYGNLRDHWFRFKTIVYNLPADNVRLENWLDPFNNNNWTKIGDYIDQGGWGQNGTKCGGKSDQIIVWGSPMVTFRWDHLSIDFRNLSVREIELPIENITNIQNIHSNCQYCEYPLRK